MPNLKEIKKRSGNVATAEKVALSMKNIAAAKLAKARKQYNSSKEYLRENNKILKYLLLAYQKSQILNENSYVSSFFVANNLCRLIVIIGSDRGLCGGFNAGVIKEGEKLISQLKNQNHDFLILAIGNKIKSHFARKYENKILDFKTTFEIKTLSINQILLTANYVFSLFKAGTIGSLSLVYTKFINVLSNEAVTRDVFPINYKDIINDQEDVVTSQNIVTDDFVLDMAEYIIKDILWFWIYKIVLHSLTSEHAARVNAMDNSYNNAGKLLKELSLEYNRTRQALITKELIEIISGSEAL